MSLCIYITSVLCCPCVFTSRLFCVVPSLVHILLDEIVGSTVHRCLDPAPMETSVSAHRFQLLIRRVDFGVEKEQAEAELGKTEARRERKLDPVVSSDMLEDFDEAVYWKVMTWQDSALPEEGEGPEEMAQEEAHGGTDLLTSIGRNERGEGKGLMEPLVARVPLPDVVTSTHMSLAVGKEEMAVKTVNIKASDVEGATTLKQQFDVDTSDVVVILRNQPIKQRSIFDFRLPWQPDLVQEREITVLATSTVSITSEEEFFDTVEEQQLLVDVPFFSPMPRLRRLSSDASYDMMSDLAQLKDMDIKVIMNPRFTFQAFSDCNIL